MTPMGEAFGWSRPWWPSPPPALASSWWGVWSGAWSSSWFAGCPPWQKPPHLSFQILEWPFVCANYFVVSWVGRPRPDDIIWKALGAELVDISSKDPVCLLISRVFICGSFSDTGRTFFIISFLFRAFTGDTRNPLASWEKEKKQTQSGHWSEEKWSDYWSSLSFCIGNTI